MKKKNFILSIVLCALAQSYCMGQKTEKEAVELREYYNDFNYVPDSGYIKSKEMVIKLAKIILESVYGESIKNRVYEAHLLENETIWVVFGKQPQETKYMMGGTPYIEIRKKDGQILKVANSK